MAKSTEPFEKVEEVRQYHHPDRLKIPVDAEVPDGMYTRWVRKEDYDSKKCDGYVNVAGKNGTIERSDSVLMAIPEKLYKEYQENNRHVTRMQENSLGFDEVNVRRG